MPYAYVRAAAAGSQYSPADSVTVVVGDPWPGGARAQLRLPYVAGCEELVAGESAELMVLCRDGAFTNFKVVREVYFPQSGLWLADYPFVNRDVFLDISLAVERGRQLQQDGQQQQQRQQQQQPPGGWGAPFEAAAWPAGEGWPAGGVGVEREQQAQQGSGDVLYASYRPYTPDEYEGGEPQAAAEQAGPSPYGGVEAQWEGYRLAPEGGGEGGSDGAAPAGAAGTAAGGASGSSQGGALAGSDVPSVGVGWDTNAVAGGYSSAGWSAAAAGQGGVSQEYYINSEGYAVPFGSQEATPSDNSNSNSSSSSSTTAVGSNSSNSSSRRNGTWAAGGGAGTSNGFSEGSGAGFVVGLAFWPGGTSADWGDPDTGLQPCNETHRANLTAMGVHFSAYSARIDRLSVFKTTFPEELSLTADALPDTPLVISVVAFRGLVRSEARYVVSGAPALTRGMGFVSTLSLMSKFELGVLKYLQFYNLTCNDCGGWKSNRCINGTSCTLPVSNCTCADATPASVPASPSPSPSPSTSPAADGTASGGSTAGASSRRLLQNTTTDAGTCNYTSFSYCAVSVNFAYEGLDVGGAAFSTAAQVRKLNSYSLVSLFAKGKSLFFDFTDKYDNTMTDYWGKFGQAQQDVVAAYSGNAEAGRTVGTA
ncbi:hypothetical protein MNEG_1608 [Monoraphidium neglectum]|uniref:Uncharacterized protein n=1 Tax=Monoraphidium neglectum TaxID=145388 RepID=A0A0D2LIQ8_9CHLO|nr:hypothetical protein MNEG_1608 [Monoraphidium neglectum]KIZ06344.1 hypothetical protein MNEG_1608 [Monoraphidium neglectum]|eukprot:XP_013905363.1 hypothetical protein MNEG_1608 [Monoraphidium neglectum]